jgi:SAM-dependent methyltransferase
VTTCPLCGGVKTEDVGPYRNESVELAGKTRVRCETCELVFVAPMPTASEWTTYNANYFARAHGRSSDTRSATLFRSGIAKLRVAHVLAELDELGVSLGTVLEIGPGHGEFVSALKAQRPDVIYLGQETDSSLFPKLRQLGVGLLGPDEIGVLPKTVDLVVISHVLEHTIDPLRFLIENTAPLRDGGALFVEVPCRDDLYKSEDEPHLQFFDKPSLGKALEMAGFIGPNLTYHGKTHAELAAENRSLLAARFARMIDRLAGPIMKGPAGLGPAEWGTLRGFAAEKQQSVRSRWLRAIATR